MSKAGSARSVKNIALLVAFLLSSSTTTEATRSKSFAAISDTDLRSQASARWLRDGFTTRMVPVNGTQLFVAEGGAGSTVVLLHGYPASPYIRCKKCRFDDATQQAASAG